MRKWIGAFLLLVLSLTNTWSLAAAQTPIPAVQGGNNPTLSSLEVDLWPEYDRPDVLVIYHLFLTQGTPLPANINLRIPASSGDPANVAIRDTDGLLYNVAYTRTIEGIWATIHFTTPSNEIQFEYYDPGLKKDVSSRTYKYQWPGDYAITSLTIQVQQPISATNMQISPALGSPLTGESDLLYYKAIVGNVPLGNEFSVSLSYQKTNDDLSVKTLKVQPATPVNDKTAGRLTVNEVLPWLLGAVGILLVGGGGWWYWQSGRAGSRPQNRKRHLSAPREVESESSLNAEIYCHQCGKRAGPGDIFCRACGTRLRHGE